MYDIKKFKSKRNATRYIILAHAPNFIKTGIPINPIVRRGSYKLTWDIWQNYWMYQQKLLDVPVHYYVELLNEDYVVFTGLNIQKNSSYLYELGNNGIITPEYKDSLLVMIGENFFYDLSEERMYKHIANRIITPMMNLYRLPFERVVLMDDCLTTNWEENLKNSQLNYEITLNKFWNMDKFRALALPYTKTIMRDGYMMSEPYGKI